MILDSENFQGFNRHPESSPSRKVQYSKRILEKGKGDSSIEYYFKVILSQFTISVIDHSNQTTHRNCDITFISSVTSPHIANGVGPKHKTGCNIK